jgi:hypothetical protein
MAPATPPPAPAAAAITTQPCRSNPLSANSTRPFTRIRASPPLYQFEHPGGRMAVTKGGPAAPHRRLRIFMQFFVKSGLHNHKGLS